MESQNDQLYFPTFNYIMEKKLRDFNINATGVDKKIPYFNKKWIQTRRALGMKVVYNILKNKYEENYKVLNRDTNLILMTKEKSKSVVLRDKFAEFETHQFPATTKTWTMACKFLEHGHLKRNDGESSSMSEEM